MSKLSSLEIKKDKDTWIYKKWVQPHNEKSHFLAESKKKWGKIFKNALTGS
jgi:hypothetical protein